MIYLRRIVLMWLAAAMVLTSGAMALSRTASEGQTVVICTGTGVSTIQVDQNGDKIDPLPVCPECLLFDVALTPPHMAVVKPTRFTLSQWLALAPAIPAGPSLTANARGPPTTI